MIEGLLKYYKEYYGIDALDETDDFKTKLQLEVALHKAKRLACDWSDWTDVNSLPASVLLGIIIYANLAISRAGVHGIKSESIGGMSQSFQDFTEDSGYYQPAYDLFAEYCAATLDVNQMYVIKARRRGCS